MGLSNSKGACLGKSDVSPSKKGRSNASDFKVFDIVSTVYGVGFVLEVRSTDYVVKLMNWKLAQGQSPTLYLAKESMRRIELVPAVLDTKTVAKGDNVVTVYGDGFVESVRKDKSDYVVRLNNWKLAQGQSPTLYLAKAFMTKVLGVKVGSYAKTVYGLVVVKDILRDGKHICEAIHWKMADGKSPTFFLAPEVLTPVPLERI